MNRHVPFHYSSEARICLVKQLLGFEISSEGVQWVYLEGKGVQCLSVPGI